MDLGKAIVIGLVFAFVAFLFPTLVTAIEGIDVGEPLKPLLNVVPYFFLGGVMFAIISLGLRGRD